MKLKKLLLKIDYYLMLIVAIPAIIIGLPYLFNFKYADTEYSKEEEGA